MNDDQLQKNKNTILVHTQHNNKVSFIITGFGPFQGIHENPTQSLVHKIRHRYHDHHKRNHIHMEIDDIHTHVFQTAAVTVKDELEHLLFLTQQINNRCNEHKKQIECRSSVVVILIHLGVNYKGQQFQLEKYAYNNATFRVPDENGDQPNEGKVKFRLFLLIFIIDQSFDYRLYSCLP